jgi:hypothetical protein
MSALLAAVDGGTGFHHHSLKRPPFAPFFDELIYARELGAADLDRYAALIVTCRMNADLIEPHRDKLAAFVAGGGMLVAMGDTDAHRWLPGGGDWHYAPTNYWWWLEKGADSGLRLRAPDHALFRFMTLSDATWHQHGYFVPPPGAVSLIDIEGAGSILYDDRVTLAPGRIIATTLDPFAHHGTFFMPAATRFLRGFLPWLCSEIGRPAPEVAA